MKKMLLLINLHSGKGEIKNNLADIIDVYSHFEYEVTVFTSQYRGHIGDLIKQYAENYDLVVCSGGDGTLNEVCENVSKLKKQPIIGYIPSGSTNDFAASVGITKNPVEAAITSISGRSFPIDLGQIEDKCFIYVAAFGAFTNVSYETSQNLKNVLGYQAYILEGIKQLPNIKPFHMKVEWDGGTIDDNFIYGMVSNTHSVGGIKSIIADDTELDDGLFEVFLIPHITNANDIAALIKDFAEKNFENANKIYSFKTSKIKFISDDEISWTADGELSGTYKTAEIKVLNKAVTINIPHVS
jgi:YegS/Rv2252/BmrU family lipid kinase